MKQTEQIDGIERKEILILLLYSKQKQNIFSDKEEKELGYGFHRMMVMSFPLEPDKNCDRGKNVSI